jgi:hypothetical protein
VTQNPVDLDYKALSNAGSWFVGKLQTEQDKARLLDGLESLQAGESFKRSAMDKLISALDKRVFLLHNVHAKKPQIFHTRWAMAYLRGPITRDRLGELNAFVAAKIPSQPALDRAPVVTKEAASPTSEKRKSTAVASARPALPKGVTEFFLPNNQTISEAIKVAGVDKVEAPDESLIYRPAVLAQALVRYLNRKNDIDESRTVTAMVTEVNRQGIVRWDDWTISPVEHSALDPKPIADAQFAPIEAPLTDGQLIKSLAKDFLDYIYHDVGLKVLQNETLKLVAKPGMTKADFLQQCSEAARKQRDDEVDKLGDKYEKKINTLEDRLAREERELAEDEAELAGRKMEELATHAENILGVFSGSRSKRKVSSSLTKRRMTSKAKADVEESLEEIQDLREELLEMEAELKEEIEEVEARWAEVANQIDDLTLQAYKKDIREDLFGLAWVPYWRVKIGSQEHELEAYRPG